MLVLLLTNSVIVGNSISLRLKFLHLKNERIPDDFKGPFANLKNKSEALQKQDDNNWTRSTWPWKVSLVNNTWSMIILVAVMTTLNSKSF